MNTPDLARGAIRSFNNLKINTDLHRPTTDDLDELTPDSMSSRLGMDSAVGIDSVIAESENPFKSR